MKRILVTGAGSGLGKEIAKEYAKEGTHIILVGRDEERLRDTALEIEAMHVSAEYIVCDISSCDSVKKLKDKIVHKHGTIEYLINNAGIGHFGPLGELSEKQIEDMLNVNVKGTIFMTQCLLPYIKERILNIISTAGLKGKVNESVYVASKFAIRGFTESLQKELEGKEVRVTAVYMGGMNTPFWDNSNHIKDKGRLREPSKVAQMIKSMDDGREQIIVE